MTNKSKLIYDTFHAHLIPCNQIQIEQILHFYEFSLEWNARNFLFSTCTFEYWLYNHLLDSVLPFTLIQNYDASFWKVHSILDIGSGGGYPGVPLHILFDLPIYLCDVTQRKLKFYEALQQNLGLSSLRIQPGGRNYGTPYAIIISRALGTMELLLKETKGFRTHTSRLLLWKGRYSKSLSEWVTCKPSLRKTFHTQVFHYTLPYEHKERSLVLLQNT